MDRKCGNSNKNDDAVRYVREHIIAGMPELLFRLLFTRPSMFLSVVFSRSLFLECRKACRRVRYGKSF